MPSQRLAINTQPAIQAVQNAKVHSHHHPAVAAYRMRLSSLCVRSDGTAVHVAGKECRSGRGGPGALRCRVSAPTYTVPTCHPRSILCHAPKHAATQTPLHSPPSTCTSRPRSASSMSRQACWWEGLSVVGCKAWPRQGGGGRG